MKLSRRSALLMASALAGAGLAQAMPQAYAETYPARQVKVIVPFAAGGPTDVMARLIAQKLSESLKQQFYVENHPGAGGNIGMTIVARANPDGYTMLVASSSFVVNPSLYAKNPYDAFKDFEPVTLAAASPNILVVQPRTAGEDGKGVGRSLEGKSFQIRYRQPRHRHDATARRGIVQALA